MQCLHLKHKTIVGFFMFYVVPINMKALQKLGTLLFKSTTS